MINWLSDNAAMTGLFFFLLVFGFIVAWTYRPSNKERLEEHKFIPISDDEQEPKS